MGKLGILKEFWDFLKVRQKMVDNPDRGGHGPLGRLDRVFTRVHGGTFHLHPFLIAHAALSFQEPVETDRGRMF